MKVTADYRRKMLIDTPERQVVVITLKPDNCSGKHYHAVDCRVKVVFGRLSEIRDNGSGPIKHTYRAGQILPDLPIGQTHIVLNEGKRPCVFRNTYEPALIQKEVPMTLQEKKLCGLSETD